MAIGVENNAIPPHTFALVRRLTVWVLCNNGLVSLQGLRLALGIDSLHTELVFLALLQTSHVELRRLGFAARHPLAGKWIQLLNLRWRYYELL